MRLSRILSLHHHALDNTTVVVVAVAIISLFSCNVNAAGDASSSTTTACWNRWCLGRTAATLQNNNNDKWVPCQRESNTSHRRIIKAACCRPIKQVTSPSANSCRAVENTPRGGAAAAAAAVATSAVAKVKTMTSRQMEAFNLLSGGVAGTVAACLTNPLEVIKTQLQSSVVVATSGGPLSSGRGHPLKIAQTILEQDGISGFFRGLPATLIGIIPARSAYFYAYQRSKRAMGPYLSEGSPANALVAGLLAGIVGNSLTNPIWMVRTRMQLLIDQQAGQRAYTGYRDAITTIFREEGIGGFYKGIAASYWGCTEGAIQFILYEQFKKRLLLRQQRTTKKNGLSSSSSSSSSSPSDNNNNDKLPEHLYFLSAALAKALASIATYPHEVARTRLREQARSGLFKYHGMWQTLSLIAKEEGRQSLYSGMGVHLMKVVPNSALMFVTYEVVNHWLGQFQIVDSNDAPGNLMARR